MSEMQHPDSEPATLEFLSKQLWSHEKRSEHRYQELCDKIETPTERGGKMGMDNLSDKINVNVGEQDGGGAAGLLPMAMMAMNRGGNYGGAGLAAGAGLVGGIVLGSVLGGGRRGGLFGGGDDAGNGNGAETRLQTNADTLAILGGLNRVNDQVTAVGSTASINLLQQTNEIQALASAAALANANGFAQTKDAITNTGTVLFGAINQVNSNVLEQGCQTRAAIAASTTAILSRIDQSEIQELRRRAETAEHSIQVNALASKVEVNQTVTTTAAATAQQAQLQFQLQSIGQGMGTLNNALAGVLQVAHATNNNVIAGNTGAVTTGAQTSTASPTNVSTL